MTISMTVGPSDKIVLREEDKPTISRPYPRFDHLVDSPLFDHLKLLSMVRQDQTPDTADEKRDEATIYEEPERAPSSTFPILYPDIDINATQAQLGWWWSPRSRLNASIQRSGDPGTAASIYLSHEQRIFEYDNRYFDFAIRGMIGLFTIFPEADIKKRVVVGTSLSISIFTGGKLDLGPVFIRGGVEIPATLMIGYHRSLPNHLPINFGASVGAEFGEFRFGAGAEFDLFLTNMHVQDASNVGLFLQSGRYFAFFDYTHVGLEIGYRDYFNAGAYLDATLTLKVPLEDFNAYAGLQGLINLEGGDPYNWVGEAPGAMVVLGGSWGSGPMEASVTTYFGMSDIDPFTYEQSGSTEEWNDLIELMVAQDRWPKGGTLTCTGQKGREGSVRYECWGEGGGRYLDCFQRGSGSISCNTGYDGVRVTAKTLLMTEQPYVDSGFLVADRIELKAEVIGQSSDSEIVNAIVQSENLEMLVERLSVNLDSYEQLEALNLLADLAYRTYDRQGLEISSGTGRVNTIDPEDLFQDIKRTLYGSDEHTTVCRGFAHFIAYIGSRLGFETHSIGIQTGSAGHVITLLRKGGEDYKVINYGDEGVITTGERTIQRAVQEYCLRKKYPPSLQIDVYGPNGQRQMILETNEFRLMKGVVLPEKRLHDYLRGR